MTFHQLKANRPWKAIRDCPGRYVLPPTDETVADLVGADAGTREYRLATARDPIVVAAIVGGGVISYRRSDGRYTHTLNTSEGYARKLDQLGISNIG
jgi:hypothetical protein